MERITRTLTLLEIEMPSGEARYINPGDIVMEEGCTVLGMKRIRATMPLSVFVENAYIEEVEHHD